MSLINKILSEFDLPKNCPGELVLQKLNEFDFDLNQYQDEQKLEVLHATIMDIRQKSILNEFCAHDKLDLTIFICCCMKLRIQPNQTILDLFVSRSRRFVDPLVIRQHYYNHKKSKKLLQLEIVFGYKFSDFSLNTEAKVIFAQYFYPIWLRYILGDDNIKQTFPEVFSIVEKQDIPSDAIKVQIQQLEQRINQKLNVKQRSEETIPLEKTSSSKSIEEKLSRSRKSVHKSLETRDIQDNAKQQDILDFFQNFDELKPKLHMADFASQFSEPQQFQPKTENESPAMALEFKKVDRQVINPEDLDEISNALLNLAIQSEKSQPEKKDQSLFSSFM